MPSESPIRVAYADPPYPGQAKKHYGKEWDPYEAIPEEVDYPHLVTRLLHEFPDGWALSMRVTDLQTILPMLSGKFRILAWVKEFAFWKKNVWPVYAWEPVVMVGCRRLPHHSKHLDGADSPRDWFSVSAGADNGKNGIPEHFVGAKPKAFCHWLFRCMGLIPGDILVDLYPGSGSVSKSWDSYRSQRRLIVEETPE